jgi:hypothetical protein
VKAVSPFYLHLVAPLVAKLAGLLSREAPMELIDEVFNELEKFVDDKYVFALDEVHVGVLERASKFTIDGNKIIPTAFLIIDECLKASPNAEDKEGLIAVKKGINAAITAARSEDR